MHMNMLSGPPGGVQVIKGVPNRQYWWVVLWRRNPLQSAPSIQTGGWGQTGKAVATKKYLSLF